MKKTIIAALAMASMALTSCFKTDPTVYGCTDICNVESSALISDYGSTYHVMETKVQDWKSRSRLFISYDILETVGVNEYNIRLNDATDYTVKQALIQSESTSDQQGRDAVYINKGFFSGSIPYFNIQCVYAHKKKSTGFHDINLVYDDEKSNATNLIFHLRHNAFGDTYMEGVDISDCESVAECYSFPMSQFMKKGTGEIHITVNYDWYKTSGNTTLPETMTFDTSTTINF